MDIITTHQMSDQEIERRKSLEFLIQNNINPYPAEAYPVNVTAEEIKKNYDEQKNNYQDVSIAGRMMSRRIMGKVSFIELQDHTGKIQVYIKRDTLCPGEDKSLYNIIFKKHFDIGDIIGIKGFVFITQSGEITIHATEIKMLAKAIRPLPIVKEKDGKVFDAFTDPEQRYRQRYLDLILNPKSRDVFIKRTKIVNSMRDFLNSKGYLEVETPILQPIYGGASARPFVTHHNTLDIDLYLRIANELYLKRLIVGGLPAVYEFSKDFRNEGMDRFHNPEFTQMELYVAYKDYIWMMELVEQMVEYITVQLYGTTKVKVGENEIDFKAPWKRLTMYDAIKEFTGIDISNMNEEELRKTAKTLGIEVDETMGKGKLIDEIFGETVEPNLIQPTFIMDYPVEMSPLAKKHRSKPGLVERFEVIVNGKELANAYSELNDPIDQRKRFEEQLLLAKRGDKEAMMLDEDFLQAIEYGMPPTAGLGIGIDRLTMLLTDSHSIQDVILFPQMKPDRTVFELNELVDKLQEAGVPTEWIKVFPQIGIKSLKALKNIKPGKLHQDLCGFNKKNKLNLTNPSLEEVEKWLEGLK